MTKEQMVDRNRRCAKLLSYPQSAQKISKDLSTDGLKVTVFLGILLIKAKQQACICLNQLCRH
jgi:hypothetical protein